ncbi:MAG: glutathione S-transferase [Thalassolituus sp.]
MKLYDNPHAPNPRRVRMVLAEKGITCDVETLDLAAGDNLKEEFCAKNPFAKVPVLELDDGLCLSESLYGTSPKERAIIDMWNERMESMLLNPAMFAFQHITGFFKDRMTPVEAFGQESAKNFLKALPVLETQLANNEWIAGGQFSIADITALVAIDFARIVKVRVGDDMPNIQRWYGAMRERASYKA